MDINVNLDANTINAEVASAVAKSAIGTELSKQITAVVKRLGSSFESPVKKVVDVTVAEIIRKVVKDTYTAQIEALVIEKLTTKFLKDVVDSMWAAWESKL